jgi:hypothetical protein
MPPSKSVKCGQQAAGGISASHMLALNGPTLQVDIGFDPNYNAATMPQGTMPNLAMRGVAALVDTGASESYIDDAVATSLSLTIVDRQVVSGSNGKHTVNMYLAHIYVPAFGVTVYGRFGGVGLASGGQRHVVLIGRTFLMHFNMTYDGPSGDVELTMP